MKAKTGNYTYTCCEPPSISPAPNFWQNLDKRAACGKTTQKPTSSGDIDMQGFLEMFLRSGLGMWWLSRETERCSLLWSRMEFY